MTHATVAAPRRSRRALAAKIAGIVGVVICVALILGLWIGRGAIANALDELSSDVAGAFDRAIGATSTIAGRLDDAASSMDGVQADATELAANPNPPPEQLAGLLARLSNVADKYGQLRQSYADLRENVVAASARVQQVARLIPGERIPEGAGDTLRAVDDKLTAIDDALTSTFAGVGQGAISSAVAKKLADGAGKVEAAISDGAATVRGVTARLETAKSNAVDTVDSIQTVVLIATIVISLLLLWVLLLNVALWLLGRARQREQDAAATGGATSEATTDTSSAVAGE